MNKSDFKVGGTVYLSPKSWHYQSGVYLVIKVARKYATVVLASTYDATKYNEELKVSLETMEVIDSHTGSPTHHVYASKVACDEWEMVSVEWQKLYRSLSAHAPRSMTMDKLNHIKAILEECDAA